MQSLIKCVKNLFRNRIHPCVSVAPEPAAPIDMETVVPRTYGHHHHFWCAVSVSSEGTNDAEEPRRLEMAIALGEAEMALLS